jgi:hypothetical protein
LLDELGVFATWLHDMMGLALPFRLLFFLHGLGRIIYDFFDFGYPFVGPTITADFGDLNTASRLTRRATWLSNTLRTPPKMCSRFEAAVVRLSPVTTSMCVNSNPNFAV